MAACKKSFLEVEPKGKLIPTTFDDFDKLMNNSSLYYYDNGLWQPAMLMGDEISAEGTTYNTDELPQTRFMFQWAADIFIHSPIQFTSADNPAFVTQTLSSFYTVNMVLEGAGRITDATEAQVQDLRGQALANRAYLLFQMLNYFAKPYSASATSDPGFPIITTADATNTDFKRGTLQQSYDAVINDLTTAIPLLKVQPAFATRMSKPAAEALLGKVYLFMGKYADALAQFNAAFDDMGRMNNAPRLYDYNQEFAAGGSFLPINDQSGPASPFNNITDVTESLVAKMSYAGDGNGHSFSTIFMTISPQTVALFQPSDWRLKLYTPLQKTGDSIPFAPAPNRAVRLRKYGQIYARIGIELPELYLLRAEARARNNDLPGAVADVAALRSKRIPAADAGVPAAASASASALLHFIMEERIREFAGEGYRWFDQRRLSTDPLFAGQAATHVLYGVDGKVSQTFTLTTDRLTLRIPPPYLSAHPEMQDNP